MKLAEKCLNELLPLALHLDTKILVNKRSETAFVKSGLIY